MESTEVTIEHVQEKITRLYKINSSNSEYKQSIYILSDSLDKAFEFVEKEYWHVDSIEVIAEEGTDFFYL